MSLKFLLLLSKQALKRRVNAVLCGPVVVSDYDKRFLSVEEGVQWIKRMSDKINQSELIDFIWIPGAEDPAKKRLYEDAQIFVLPTRYPVEAQPLVVLEAMSHACALITSKAGELPSTVDSQCAILLESPTVHAVADAMLDLLQDQELTAAKGNAAWERFRSNYTLERNFSAWQKLLKA